MRQHELYQAQIYLISYMPQPMNNKQQKSKQWTDGSNTLACLKAPYMYICIYQHGKKLRRANSYTQSSGRGDPTCPGVHKGMIADVCVCGPSGCRPAEPLLEWTSSESNNFQPSMTAWPFGLGLARFGSVHCALRFVSFACNVCVSGGRLRLPHVFCSHDLTMHGFVCHAECNHMI